MGNGDGASIRILGLEDREAFEAFRLAALRAQPEAFATSADAWAEISRAQLDAMLDPGDRDRSLWVLGAFDPAMIGMIGLRRESRPSTRHKASLWGLFVDPGGRRRGIGERLVRAALDVARAQPGLERVRLVVAVTDDAAVRLFERVGFTAFGIEQRARYAGGTFHDQAYMSLTLPQTMAF